MAYSPFSSSPNPKRRPIGMDEGAIGYTPEPYQPAPAPEIRHNPAAPTGGGDVTQQAIAEMRSVFSNATEANAAIKENMRELAEAGVDIAALYNAAEGLGRRRVGTSDY